MESDHHLTPPPEPKHGSRWHQLPLPVWVGIGAVVVLVGVAALASGQEDPPGPTPPPAPTPTIVINNGTADSDPKASADAIALEREKHHDHRKDLDFERGKEQLARKLNSYEILQQALLSAHRYDEAIEQLESLRPDAERYGIVHLVDACAVRIEQQRDAHRAKQRALDAWRTRLADFDQLLARSSNAQTITAAETKLGELRSLAIKVGKLASWTQRRDTLRHSRMTLHFNAAIDTFQTSIEQQHWEQAAAAIREMERYAWDLKRSGLVQTARKVLANRKAAAEQAIREQRYQRAKEAYIATDWWGSARFDAAEKALNNLVPLARAAGAQAEITILREHLQKKREELAQQVATYRATIAAILETHAFDRLPEARKCYQKLKRWGHADTATGTRLLSDRPWVRDTNQDRNGTWIRVTSPGQVSMAFRWVPSNSDEGGWWMSQHEITTYQFHAVTGLYADQRDQNLDYPVVHIQPEHATRFCELLSDALNLTVRLPTEAEWLSASTGGLDAHPFYGAERRATAFAWYAENSNDSPHPIGRKLPNRYGLLDVIGNAAELVQGDTGFLHCGGSFASQIWDLPRIDTLDSIQPEEVGFRVLLEDRRFPVANADSSDSVP